jgi:hypothetical protein
MWKASEKGNEKPTMKINGIFNASPKITLFYI